MKVSEKVCDDDKLVIPSISKLMISVIIPVYNELNLDHCLNAIYRSEDINFEVIVIDDGSTKVDIEKVTSKYPSCKTYSFKKNKGASAARNYGVKKANGEIVFFIDADAMVNPDTLKIIVERFEKEKSIDGITIPWSDVPIEGGFFNKFKCIEMNYVFNNFGEKVFGSNGSAIYKDKFLEGGSFDESYKSAHAEDFDLGIKLYGCGYNLIYDNHTSIKNSYADYFLFKGLLKYSKRAFLRAIVIFKTKNKIVNMYNSKKFLFVYFLSLCVSAIILISIINLSVLPLILIPVSIFGAVNLKLYQKCLEKYGILFSIKSFLFHMFYTCIVSLCGISGFAYAFLTKK